jgi:hypothetical protein
MFSADRKIISFHDCDRKFPSRKKTESKHKYSPTILHARDKTEVEALWWTDVEVRVLTRSLNAQTAGAAPRVGTAAPIAEVAAGDSRRYTLFPRGALAQLVRAPPCHGGGCGFEPRRLRSWKSGAATVSRLLGQKYFRCPTMTRAIYERFPAFFLTRIKMFESAAIARKKLSSDR